MTNDPAYEDKGKLFRAAIYGRISSSPQKLGSSLDVQIQKCREKADSMGYAIYDEYLDVATATNINRPGFSRLLNDAINSRFDILIVTDTSRLFRNVHDARMYKYFLRNELNIQIIFVDNEYLDTLMEKIAEIYDAYVSFRASLLSSSGKYHRVVFRKLPNGRTLGYKVVDIVDGG